MSQRRPHILLGITGSIAAVKGPRLALLLSRNLKAHVRVVLTRTVEQHFWREGGVTQRYDEVAWKEFWEVVNACNDYLIMDDDDKNDDWRLSNGNIAVHYAEEEWHNYESLSQPVKHIELRAWADILLVAPLSAHTLAKLANGLCDDLLSCIARAWDFGQRDDNCGKPVVLCPAMNTAMWDHVLTKRQLDIVRGFGMGSCSNNDTSAVNDNDDGFCVKIVEPVVKKLACGDVGAGALAELEDIISCVERCLDQQYSSKRNPRTISRDISNEKDRQQQTLYGRKTSMKKALLRYSKQKFFEMQSSHEQELAAPISPTPNDIINLFLPHLNLGPNSLLVDLGCGDGRWLITASKLTNCKCLGIEVDDQRIELANQSIEQEGLAHQIQVCKRDIFDFVKSDCDYFAEIDVFIVYLFRDAMFKIGTLLQQRSSDLKQGVKILCVGFALPQWKAIRTEKSSGLTIYLYEYSKGK